jgi:hypothetical protein
MWCLFLSRNVETQRPLAPAANAAGVLGSLVHTGTCGVVRYRTEDGAGPEGGARLGR